MPTKTVTPERRAELVTERNSFPRVGKGWQCTDVGCKYHSKPMVAKYPEKMQEHYQKAHVPGGKFELLCREIYCPSVVGTYNSWKCHPFYHKDILCPVSACETKARSDLMLDHLRNFHAIPLPSATERDVRLYKDCEKSTRAWEQRQNVQGFDYHFYEKRLGLIFDPEEHIDTSDDESTADTLHEDQEVNGSDNDSYDQPQESDETTILAAQTPKPSLASDPAHCTSTGKKTGPPQVLREFLSALFTGSDDLREADLYQTFNGPFFIGSFVNKRLFRSYLPEYTNSPSYNCFVLASSIMWLAKIDRTPTLAECLSQQLEVAKNSGNDDTYFLQYRSKSNDAFYDFLYGLYVKVRIDPEHEWFTRPGSQKLAQLLYNLAGEKEQDGMYEYDLKTQNMLALVEEREIDKTELTNSVWTDALEEWLKNYGELQHQTLGDYLCEIVEREVRRIKVET